MYRITLIPGDGIGPEISRAAIRVIEATGVRIEWEEAVAGLAAFEKFGKPLPQETLESIARNRMVLKGPLGTPIGKGYRSATVAIRKKFDLFAGLRPVKIFRGVPTRYANEPIDIVGIRENTEEFYVGEETIDEARTVATAIGRVTRSGSERIARFAFEYARKHGRKTVTFVHKANILKNLHGLFLEVGQEVAREYPDIACNDRIVDNMLLQIIANPAQFDVVVAPNFPGDIISDAFAGLVGGLGFAPSGNIGKDAAMFEAVHGTAPDIAGRNIANPTALILSAAMMLDHLGEADAAARIEVAVRAVIAEGKYVTRDIDPKNGVGTDEMATAIVDALLWTAK